MYRKVLIGGATAAAIVGAGGTALALSGTDQTTSGSASLTSAQALGGQHRLLGHGRLLRRLEHAQIVTKGKAGAVTHNLIVGTVTSVSSSSITVRAADATSETFGVTGDTKVRVRSNGQGAASTISHVTEGDQVLVAGTGTTTLTAKHVIDIKK